jgi:amino acid adenylation domain-containing protein
VAGRARPEIARTVGLFVNMLPLRVDASGDPTVKELVARVRQVALHAFEREDVPFERVVEALAPPRDLSRSPIFQVLLTLHDEELPAVREIDTGASRLDLSLDLRRDGDGLTGVLEYATDLFDAAEAARFAARLSLLLEAFTAETRLSDLPMLPEAERALVVDAWNATSFPLPDRRVHEMIADQPEDAPALLFEGRTVSYGELDRRATQLAYRLNACGVGPGSLVGVQVDRSIEAVIAFLGVLKSGGAFVAIDPSLPQKRIDRLRADLTVVITDVEDREEAPRPLPRPGQDDLAYVIYTSGSTGVPKGVMIPHGAIANRVLVSMREHPLVPGDRMLQATSFSFDVSVWEIITALASGACLVIARADKHHDAAYLARLIAGQRVTMCGFTPSFLALLLDEPELARATSLAHVYSGGEAMPPDLPARFFGRLPRALLHNFYGPTEATIDATSYTCKGSEDRVPIGRPLGNVRAYVLDAKMRPVPIGVPGDLYIGGRGLARGYLNEDHLTRERFLATPHGRLYKTGDRARWRASGDLDFLGREDDQVKVRGFRIELGEIESVLAKHPSVKEVIVTVRDRAA